MASSGERSGIMSNWEKQQGEMGLGLKMRQFQFQQHPDIYNEPQPHQRRRDGTRQEDAIPYSFTAGQRQELERQTVIYKYMMASMPVPPQLLHPLHSHSSEVGRRGVSKNGGGGGLELRSYNSSTSTSTREMRGDRGGGGDPEPWRCRRTDGKKWRCSRDVAPDQKYCERHSHKGRPSRSRKPVESLVLTPNAATTTNTTTTTSSGCNPITLRPPSSSTFDFGSQNLSSYSHFPRYPDEWFMRKESTVAVPLCPPQQIHPIQMGAENARGVGEADHPDTTNSPSSEIMPRPFIDAWSLREPTPNTITTNGDVTNNCPASSSSPLHSILPLTLGIDHDINVHNDDNTTRDHDHIHTHNVDHRHHHQPLNWMSSWISSPPGGPLAEALCLGMSSMSGTSNGMAGTNSTDELLSPHARSTSSTGSKASHASADHTSAAQGFHLP